MRAHPFDAPHTEGAWPGSEDIGKVTGFYHRTVFCEPCLTDGLALTADRALLAMDQLSLAGRDALQRIRPHEPCDPLPRGIACQGGKFQQIRHDLFAPGVDAHVLGTHGRPSRGMVAINGAIGLRTIYSVKEEHPAREIVCSLFRPLQMDGIARNTIQLQCSVYQRPRSLLVDAIAVDRPGGALETVEVTCKVEVFRLDRGIKIPILLRLLVEFHQCRDQETANRAGFLIVPAVYVVTFPESPLVRPVVDEEIPDPPGEFKIRVLVYSMIRKQAEHPHGFCRRPSHVTDIGFSAGRSVFIEIMIVGCIQKAARMLCLHERIIDSNRLVQQVLVSVPQGLDGKHPRIQEVLAGPADFESLAVCSQVGPVFVLHPLRHFFSADHHRGTVVGHAVGIMLVHQPFPFVQIQQGMDIADPEFENLIIIQAGFQLGIQQDKGFFDKTRRREMAPSGRADADKALRREGLARSKFYAGIISRPEYALRLIRDRRFGHRADDHMLEPPVRLFLKRAGAYEGLWRVRSGKERQSRAFILGQGAGRNPCPFVGENPGLSVVSQSLRGLHISELVPVVVDARNEITMGAEGIQHPDFVLETDRVAAGVPDGTGYGIGAIAKVINALIRQKESGVRRLPGEQFGNSGRLSPHRSVQSEINRMGGQRHFTCQNNDSEQ